LNWQTNWFFQNHSDNPNVNTFPTDNPRIFEFITDRDIEEGEELLENYDDYSYKWEKISQNGKSG
jgi:SET domain-containing protein